MLRSRLFASLAVVFSLSFLFIHPSFAGTYTVAPGDSLYNISKLFYTSTSKIMNDNNLGSDKIYPGQKFYVPADTYSVKYGDSLYSIAQSKNITLYSLKKANNEWDNYIYPGQSLNLPGIVNGKRVQSSASSSSGAVIPYSSSDFDLLARLIMAEAEGESYNAKVGVGAVVVNRVQSAEWPNSISSVIYQKINGYYQFTPVQNGWINRQASQEAKDAAYDALHGSDPTKGAIFYFDDSTTNKWMWSRPIAARIGRMVYTY